MFLPGIVMKTSKLPFIFFCTVILASCFPVNAAEAVSQSESDAARIAMLEKALAPAELGKILDSFKREISFADEPEEYQAFHALNMALEMYLRNNLINPEQVARDKLHLIDASIQQSLRTMEGRRPRCVVRDRLRFL